MRKDVIKIKLFQRSLIWKYLLDFEASKFSQGDQFLVCCPFKGGYFSPVDLEMGVCVCLQMVSARVRLKLM